MRFWFTYLLICLLFLGSLRAEPLKEFDLFVEKARQDWHTPGVAMAIVQDGKVIFSRGFGYRDLEKKLPVTSRTQFVLASLTKAFTAFVLGTLVDEGKLEWDTPIKTYVPNFQMSDREAAENVSVRDLLRHTTGLPEHDGVWFNSNVSIEEVIARLPHLESNKKFRSAWQYNNAMFGVAGFVAQTISKQSWESLVAERILKPLGMKQTYFSIKETQKREVAYPYEFWEGQVQRIAMRDIRNMIPAGGLNSCLEDVVLWLKMQMNGGRYNNKVLIEPATLNEMHTPQFAMPPLIGMPEVTPVGYGLGWNVLDYEGHPVISHSGYVDGFSNYIAFLPEDNIGIVVLTNVDKNLLAQILTYEACDRLLNLPMHNWHQVKLKQIAMLYEAQKEAKGKRLLLKKQGTTPAHALEDYLGEYEHPAYGTAKVELRDGKLFFVFHDIATSLDHWHYEVFEFARQQKDHYFEGRKVTFLTDLSGDVSAVCAPMEPLVKEIVFRRVASKDLLQGAYLSKFAGQYQFADQKIDILWEGGSLKMMLPGQPKLDLVPLKNNLFQLKQMGGHTLFFGLDDEGKVKEMYIDRPAGNLLVRKKVL